ncbi:hypothetical protein HMPREF9333_00804 [Johnsonella ignava ATCC 51276]|jgi:cobalt ABC transporter, permease protein cbiQ|uniref:Cobalt ABC transporter n=1 Tax=Johnsonella ignava ATCC 51276 TaxID=679200 RepID=G5GGW4_9FIRM|nr:cobalt ECF transporter T component CbiQ [Johnsonella ignava]EHI56022.1 hypothetical protein HMPREF9333_00804 [Johnsonella ignava ATCC 51276]
MAHKHGGSFSMDMYAFNSKLKYLNPDYKLICSVYMLIITISLNDIYVCIYVLLSMFFINIFLGGLDVFEYISVLSMPLGFLVFAGVALAFGISFEPVGEFYIKAGFFYIYSSKFQIAAAFKIAVRALSCISIMQALILSTMSYEVISALKNMRIPKLIIEIMNLIYRFIFILLDVHENMKNAALSRLGYHNIKSSFITFGSTAGNMFITSLKKADDYYTAMEARSFNGDLNFLQEEKKIRLHHIVAAFVYILSVFAVWAVHVKYLKGVKL